jgi:uncharacterized protein (DUF302 family)
MTEGSDLMEIASPTGFAATLDGVVRAIERAGLKIFVQVDHAAAAAAAGLTMPPTTVVLYGRAEGGTPIMLAAPNAALDLPLRVLVREEASDRTIIAFHPIASVLARVGAPEATWRRLEPAQRLLVDAFPNLAP